MKYNNGRVEIGYFKNSIPMDKCSMKMINMMSKIFIKIHGELWVLLITRIYRLIAIYKYSYYTVSPNKHGNSETILN